MSCFGREGKLGAGVEATLGGVAGGEELAWVKVGVVGLIGM